MTTDDDSMIITEEEATSLYEIYLSGFVSGAISFAITHQVPEEVAKSIAEAMSDSLMADEATREQIGALISACLNGEDVPDHMKEVRNVRYGS